MPRITLQEQWDTLKQELKRREVEFAEGTFNGNLPDRLFRVTTKGEIQELCVTGPGYLYPNNVDYIPHGQKGPKTIDVVRLRYYLDSAPPHSIDNLLLYWKNVKHGGSAAYFLNPAKRDEFVFFTLEEAETSAEKIKAQRSHEAELLDSGHIRCQYCGDIRKPEDITYARMWNRVYRGGQSDPRPYCKDKGCATYDQMGHEG